MGGVRVAPPTPLFSDHIRGLRGRGAEMFVKIIFERGFRVTS